MSEIVAMVVTDLDGTLLGPDGRLGAGDHDALVRLGMARVVRVVATGRSLWSAHQVLGPTAPIDYLVFSSGVGVERWRDGRLLRIVDMPGAAVDAATATLDRHGLDFMVHRAAPENHHFYWRRAGSVDNPDFERRLARYREFAARWPGKLPAGADASQLVAIEPAAAVSALDPVRQALPECHVVRTTSPLDHRSRWIEIFPAAVSKSAASAWLAATLGISPGATLALGNDYNDAVLLAWAGRAYVVGNAVAELRARYPVVAGNDRGGFAHAVQGVGD